MPRGGGTSNGGIIGKKNHTSFGKNTIQSKTSTGCLSATQPGTRLVKALIVAGGGGGGGGTAAGAGAGGLQITEQPVSGNTAYPVTVGGGGTPGPNVVYK